MYRKIMIILCAKVERKRNEGKMVMKERMNVGMKGRKKRRKRTRNKESEAKEEKISGTRNKRKKKKKNEKERRVRGNAGNNDEIRKEKTIDQLGEQEKYKKKK